MNPARIPELLAPFLGTPRTNDPRPAANDALYAHISTYIDILLRWNARINLTAIRDPEEIVTRHFGESLFAAMQIFSKVSSQEETEKNSSESSASSVLKAVDSSLADLGSGAGFPGIPIKLWAPQIALTLIESNHKKATFLREITRALTLTDVNILTTRAENLTPFHRFGVVTLRAVERFEDTLPIAASLLTPAGRLALLIGTSQLDQARVALPSFAWHNPIPIPQSQSRVIIIGRAQAS